jgi:hypothetical protein
MADEEQAPPPTQDAAPAEQVPANDPTPTEPPAPLPELTLHEELRGGQEVPHLYTALVESKDVETKDS